MAADVTYDPEAVAMIIRFADGEFEGEEVRPGVILHFDAADSWRSKCCTRARHSRSTTDRGCDRNIGLREIGAFEQER